MNQQIRAVDANDAIRLAVLRKLDGRVLSSARRKARNVGHAASIAPVIRMPVLQRIECGGYGAGAVRPPLARHELRRMNSGTRILRIRRFPKG